MTRFLITAVALASVFGGQQVVAKNSTKNTAASKKHKKRHKIGAVISSPAVTAGTDIWPLIPDIERIFTRIIA